MVAKSNSKEHKPGGNGSSVVYREPPKKTIPLIGSIVFLVFLLAVLISLAIIVRA